MKYSNSIALAFATLSTFALSSHATIIVDDTWADGNRTSSGPDGGGIDSPWYSSTGSLLVAAPGSMTLSPSSSLTTWTYFAPSGSPIQLSVGDTLQVTLSFTITGPGAQNASRALRFGLFDYNTGTRRITDGGSPSGTGVKGYTQNMNFGSTFGVANALQTQKRDTPSGDSGNLLSSSGDFSTVGVNGGGNAVADPAFSASTTYTLTYSVTRTDAGSVDITTTFDGSSLNGGTLTQTVTDAGDIYTSFDTFSFRPNAPATTATTFTFSEFKVEYLPVPEPSTFALAGLGLLGLAGALSPRAPVNYLGFFQRVPTLPAPVFTDFK